jgi:hypothetical protein
LSRFSIVVPEPEIMMTARIRVLSGITDKDTPRRPRVQNEVDWGKRQPGSSSPG